MSRTYGPLVVIGLCCLQIGLVLTGVTGVVRVASGFLFVTVLPGYSLLRALYRPYRQEFNPIEQVALAVPVSLAMGAVLGLLFDNIGWSVRPTFHVLWLSFITCALALAPLVPGQGETELTAKAGWGAVLIGLVCLALGLGLVARDVSHETRPQVVSLFLLNAEGKTAHYPARIKINAAKLVRIGVAYQGPSPRAFSLWTPTGTRTSLVLHPGQTWSKLVPVVSSKPGLQELTWKLSDAGSSTATRSVHLWVWVS
jgi:uncharacterized membrane protein